MKLYIKTLLIFYFKVYIYEIQASKQTQKIK